MERVIPILPRSANGRKELRSQFQKLQMGSHVRRRSAIPLRTITMLVIALAQAAIAAPTNRYVVKSNVGAAEPYDD